MLIGWFFRCTHSRLNMIWRERFFTCSYSKVRRLVSPVEYMSYSLDYVFMCYTNACINTIQELLRYYYTQFLIVPTTLVEDLVTHTWKKTIHILIKIIHELKFSVEETHNLQLKLKAKIFINQSSEIKLLKFTSYFPRKFQK